VFDVVRSAGSSVYNYDNPVRRDVVNSGVQGDMTTIRFKTDNAGPWIMHWFVAAIFLEKYYCLLGFDSHIDWHLELCVVHLLSHHALINILNSGLAVVFVEDLGGIRQSVQPSEYKPYHHWIKQALN